MKYLLLALLSAASLSVSAREIRVGSKAFTEGFLLAELAAQVMEAESGENVTRRFGLGNTGVVFEALKKGEIDVYPEYTGTISEGILRDEAIRDLEALRERLKPMNLVISKPLGFNNTYALAVPRDYAETNGLRTISDLSRVAGRVRTAFSHEFVNRKDGLLNLQKAYGLDLSRDRRSLEHSLAYEAISKRKVDLIDVYSTDSKIKTMDLVVLKDDRNYFPHYEAVFLARADFVRRSPQAWAALNSEDLRLDEEVMRRLNAGVESDKKSFAEVIALHLERDLAAGDFAGPGVAERVWQRTKEHLLLVGVTVFLSILTGLPLGILAARRETLGQGLLLAASVVQTIPSLALLCLLIPFFGIGLVPALVALYLYSLLPILLNTYVGLRSIDARLVETARALGLRPGRILFSVELPLASRNIIAGIKTSTIIGIGTATLAALIGAGGYGAPIVSGLAINDMPTILIGAVPAALMSLIAHFLFEGASRFLVPKGLRSRP